MEKRFLYNWVPDVALYYCYVSIGQGLCGQNIDTHDKSSGAYDLRDHLEKAARSTAEIENQVALLEDTKLLLGLHELVSTPGPVTILLRLVEIVVFKNEPAHRGS